MRWRFGFFTRIFSSKRLSMGHLKKVKSQCVAYVPNSKRYENGVGETLHESNASLPQRIVVSSRDATNFPAAFDKAHPGRARSNVGKYHTQHKENAMSYFMFVI